MIWLIISLIATIVIIIFVWYLNWDDGCDICMLESLGVFLLSCFITLCVVLLSSAIVSSGDNVIEYKRQSKCKWKFLYYGWICR